MSRLRDIHADKEKLLRQIKYLEENDQIDKEIEKARCPICGGKIEYVMHEGGGDSIVRPYRGVVRCTRCDMFKKEIERNSQQSYLWISDGSCEIALKRDTWNAVKYYVKFED